MLGYQGLKLDWMHSKMDEMKNLYAITEERRAHIEQEVRQLTNDTEFKFDEKEMEKMAEKIDDVHSIVCKTATNRKTLVSNLTRYRSLALLVHGFNTLQYNNKESAIEAARYASDGLHLGGDEFYFDRQTCKGHFKFFQNFAVYLEHPYALLIAAQVEDDDLKLAVGLLSKAIEQKPKYMDNEKYKMCEQIYKQYSIQLENISKTPGK